MSNIKGNLKEMFSGTELWRSLILVSGYIFLIALMFILVSRVVELLFPAFIVYAFWIAIAITAQREQKLRILRKFAGTRILTGSLDEEEDMGEIVEFEIKNIVRYEQLTDAQKKRINLVLEREKELVESLDRREYRDVIRDAIGNEKEKQKKLEDKTKTEENKDGKN